jgi:hypothetical protein
LLVLLLAHDHHGDEEVAGLDVVLVLDEAARLDLVLVTAA